MKGGFTVDKDDLVKLRPAVARGLCDRCIGRCLGKRGHGLTNEERGLMIKQAFEEPPGQVAPEACWLCQGIMSDLQKYADMIVKAFEPYEYETYLIGSKVDLPTKAREQELAAAVSPDEYEEIKSEVNREVGKLVGGVVGKMAAFENPDILALLDTRFDVVDIEVHSLYIYGRYRKLLRGIPQTRWPCRVCGGKGCRRCEGSGKMYQTSVEEKIAAPLMELLKAKEHALHGGGREDIDARMLGNGRPFVLEIRGPVRRWSAIPDLVAVEKLINERAAGDVEVSGLRRSDLKEVRAVKDARNLKTYEVEIEFSDDVDQPSLDKAMAQLRGKAIDQRTPNRVSHRRADLVRERVVRDIAGNMTGPRSARLLITGEAGIYIKELVTGDEGRTEPSLAGLIGRPCKVLALDVIRIHDEGTEGKE